jgi:hypothetical protein
MGNGYPIIQPDDLSRFVADIADMKRRLRELERPTGTQLASTVSELSSRTISAMSAAFTQSFSSNLGVTNTGASVSVTLNERRYALVLRSIEFFGTVGTGSGSRYVQGFHGFSVDGLTIDSDVISYAPSGTVGFSTVYGSTVAGMSVTEIAAGTHTVSSFVQGFVSGSGISGQFSFPSLSVVVLQAV